MIKTLILIIILLLPPIHSFASTPNGKGVICKCVEVSKCPNKNNLFWDTYIQSNKLPSEIAILFENNVAVYYYIQIINDKIKYIKETLGAYGAKYRFEVSTDFINWTNSKFQSSQLNRKTLHYFSLTDYKDGKSVKENRHCSVLDKNSLFKEMGKLVNKYQKEHNVTLKGNKI